MSLKFSVGASRRSKLDSLDYEIFHDEHGNKANASILVHSWLALLLDSPRDRSKPWCVVRRQHRRFAASLPAEIGRLATLSDKLQRSIVRDDQGCETKESLHHEFVDTPIFVEYNLWFKTGAPILFTWIQTFLNWGRKAPYANPQFAETAYQGWLSVERELESHVIPDFLLDDLKRVVDRSNLAIRLEDVQFAHGPGKTSLPEVSVLSQKCANVRYSEKLNHILAVLQERDSHQMVPNLALPDPELWYDGEWHWFERTPSYAVLVFVPKNYKTARSICKEPPAYMYIQQGVRKAFELAIERSKYAKIIDIKDQSKNRRQALHSSQDGEFSTIDEAAASDRLHVRIVKHIFSGNLRDFLLNSRSETVLRPDGKVVKVQKFAPMGSAVCFPTMSVVLASLVFLVNDLAVRGITVDQYVRRGKPQFRGDYAAADGSCVYGDDICVRNALTPDLISLLTLLGFRTNLDKSFFGNLVFRESCGMFAYSGHDVTHLMFKVKGLLEWSIKRIPGLIDLANSCYAYSYMETRRVLLRYLPPYTYVYSADSPYTGLSSCHVIGYERNDNFCWVSDADRKYRKSKHLPRWMPGDKRWNKNTQQTEYYVTKMVGRTNVPNSTGAKEIFSEQLICEDDKVERFRLMSALNAQNVAELRRETQVPNMDLEQLVRDGRAKPAVGDTGDPVLREVWTLA